MPGEKKNIQIVQDVCKKRFNEYCEFTHFEHTRAMETNKLIYFEKVNVTIGNIVPVTFKYKFSSIEMLS